jgi:hypothetical protein
VGDGTVMGGDGVRLGVVVRGMHGMVFVLRDSRERLLLLGLLMMALSADGLIGIDGWRCWR